MRIKGAPSYVLLELNITSWRKIRTAKRTSSSRCRRTLVTDQQRSIGVTIDTWQARALACMHERSIRAGDNTRSLLRESIVTWGLTAVPGVARRLAHRRRCQPGGGGGGGSCDGGRQLRRIVGRRCSGANVGSREKAIAWAHMKRTHLSRRRQRQRQWRRQRIAVSHGAWCIRGVATRRGDEADDRTRTVAPPAVVYAA